MPTAHIPLWKQAPFLQFLPALVAGIGIGWFFPILPVFYPLAATGVFIFVATGIAIVFYLPGGNISKRYAGIGIQIILFLFGIFLCLWNNMSLRPDFAGRYLTDHSFVKVKLTSPITERENSWRAEAKIKSIFNKNELEDVRGKTLLYFAKGTHKPLLRYGDVLLIPNKLEKIKYSNNPGAFNYSRYCKLRNTYFSAYLPEGQWQVLKKRRTTDLKACFLRYRKACLGILGRYIKPDRELGVAEALLLGYREDLDPKLYQAYANVGVVHLIAISGLHIGLIYLVLIWLFRFLPERGTTSPLKGTLILICLWSFTLLTGAHPSTLRAAIMLSFLVAGKNFFKREAHTFNSLAASAFLLLCINPFFLFDVGFQLSYLAVAGILVFQKPINNLLWFKQKAGNYIWELLAVSLAAQILTFPLVLYYFHQFPTIFLISNLILIPAATVALYGTIGLLAFSFIPSLANGIGTILTKLLGLMNESILWADQFHFIRLQHIYLHPIIFLFIYCFIILISVWLFYKNKKALVTAMIVVAIAGVFSLVQKWKIHTQKKLIVYQIRGHSAIEMVDGSRSRFYGDPSIWNDKQIQKYILATAKEKLHLKKRTRMPNHTPFFTFHHKKLLLVQNTFRYDSLMSILPLDYVILSGHNRLKMAEIKHHFSPNAIVLDASVAPWQRQKWKTACKQLHLHCFSVPDQGAWILSLK